MNPPQLVVPPLEQDKQLAILAALVEGNSIRSVERMTAVHKIKIYWG